MDGATPGSGSGLSFRLIYRSRNLIPSGQRKTELGSLFSAARSNNKKQHICGALLISGDWFVQTLEGDEGAVRARTPASVRAGQVRRAAAGTGRRPRRTARPAPGGWSHPR
jgi:hypothetical protein